MDRAVAMWIKCVENGSRHVKEFASTIFTRNREWTANDACFIPCLKAVRQLGDVDIFADVLRSLWEIEFHDALAPTVQQLGWDRCQDALVGVANSMSYRSRVNLVCSVLDGVTETSHVSSLLDRVDVQPNAASMPAPATRYRFYSSHEDREQPVTGDEYYRLLKIALLISPDKLRELTETPDTKAMIKVVAPGVASLVTSFSSSGDVPGGVVEVVQAVTGYLEARAPHSASWAMPQYRVNGSCCGHCGQLNAFLASSTQQTLRMPMKKADRHHIHKTIEPYCGSALSHKTDRPKTLVMTKLLSDVDLHDKAHDTLSQLRAFFRQQGVPDLSTTNTIDLSEETPALPAAPSTGVGYPSGVIEVDSDYSSPRGFQESSKVRRPAPKILDKFLYTPNTF